MKIIKKILYIPLVLLLIFVIGCNEKEPHVHNFIDGICECGEVIEIKYEVKFEVDNNIIDTQIVNKNEKVIEQNVSSKEGYTFLGWYYNDTKWDFENDVVTNNITLVAKWEKNIVTYTITLDVNGGNALSINSITFNENEIVTLPTPTKEGYTFLGWYEDNTLVTNITNKNYDLIAKWDINKYTISFDTGGESNIQSINLEYGSLIENIPTPKKDGYIFIGWDIEIPETMPSHDIVLKAIWEKEPIVEETISLQLQTFGGTVNNIAKVDSDGNIVLPIPELDNYTFSHWCSDYKLLNKVETLNKNNYNGETLYAYYTYNSDNLNSQIVVSMFNKHSTNYEDVAMFDESKSGFTSKYWHKIGIVCNDTEYVITNILKSGQSINDLGSYDYVILFYSAYPNYKELVNMNYKVGDKVKFIIDPLSMQDGMYTNIVSFITKDVSESIDEVSTYLQNLYSSYNTVSSNIDLIKQYNGNIITWKSSNREVITNDGKYTKPYVTRNVILTAFLNEIQVYEFYIKVEGINDKSTALSTGYIYTPYSITQNAMNTLDIIYCAFLDLDSNGDWKNLSKVTSNINTYIRDKAEKAGTKIVVSVNQKNSGDFSAIAASPELREKVATNILNVIQDLNIDGVDIDWETPKSTEAANFTLLMETIYKKVKAANPEYLVTAAIGGGKWQPPCYDLPNSIQYMDYVNLMTYSMTKSSGYYQNSLYPSSKGGTLVSCSISESIKIYNDYNVPNNKILVGIPFYVIIQTECEGMGSKTGSGKSGKYNVLFTTYALSETMKEYFDEEAGVPYRYDSANKIFISYDNEESIKMKCDYINSLGLAGIMYWQYGQDVDDILSNAINKYINE